MKKVFAFIAAALLSLYSIPAGAVMLTFDDIYTTDVDGPYGSGVYKGLGAVPVDYQNRDLTWTNFGVYNKVKSGMNTGYKNGVVSGNQLAFNRAANPATISSTTEFTFNGGSFIAAWNNDLRIVVSGFDKDGKLIDRYLASVKANTNSIVGLADLNWHVYSLRFSSFGGTPDPRFSPAVDGYGAEFGIDNLRVGGSLPTDGGGGTLPDVPLPAAFPLFMSGLAILGFIGYRRRA